MNAVEVLLKRYEASFLIELAQCGQNNTDDVTEQILYSGMYAVVYHIHENGAGRAGFTQRQAELLGDALKKVISYEWSESAAEREIANDILSKLEERELEMSSGNLVKAA